MNPHNNTGRLVLHGNWGSEIRNSSVRIITQSLCFKPCFLQVLSSSSSARNQHYTLGSCYAWAHGPNHHGRRTVSISRLYPGSQSPTKQRRVCCLVPNLCQEVCHGSRHRIQAVNSSYHWIFLPPLWLPLDFSVFLASHYGKSIPLFTHSLLSLASCHCPDVHSCFFKQINLTKEGYSRASKCYAVDTVLLSTAPWPRTTLLMQDLAAARADRNAGTILNAGPARFSLSK